MLELLFYIGKISKGVIMSSFIVSPLGSDLPIASINRILSRVITWLLIPICTFLLSDIFWKIYYPDTVSTRQGNNISKQLAVSGQAGNASTSWDWFRLREPPKPEPVQDARINATLVGIIGVGESGTAMIALDKGGTKIYKVGDEIKEGVFLSRLERDHVILLRGDTEEKLAIKKGANLFSSKDNKQTQYEEPPPPKVYERGSVGSFISELKENPLKLGEMIKFETVDTERYGSGIKVEPVTTAEYDVLAKLNLSPGDVVIGVDRNRVADIMEDPASYEKIIKKGEFKIQYVREGKLESTAVKIE